MKQRHYSLYRMLVYHHRHGFWPADAYRKEVDAAERHLATLTMQGHGSKAIEPCRLVTHASRLCGRTGKVPRQPGRL